jgi:voltage-gated potassium channel Kch
MPRQEPDEETPLKRAATVGFGAPAGSPTPSYGGGDDSSAGDGKLKRKTLTMILKEDEDEEKEKEDWSKTFVLIGCFLWIVLGVGVACWFEGWSVITGFYVIAQIITTVGYGDVVVTTTSAKLFCGVYVLVTIICIATYVTELASNVVGNNDQYIRDALLRAEIHVLRLRDLSDEEAEMHLKKWNEIFTAAFAFILNVCFGTVFFALYESCTCSYGVSHIEGCFETPYDLCTQTGGYVKGWGDSLYMSLITLTTVGFGDNTPKTRLGRVVGSVWMLMGVTTMANLAAKVADLRLLNEREKMRLNHIDHAVFDAIDLNHDGVVSRSEFRTYTLIKFGLVKSEDLKRIDKLFDTIDRDRNQYITFKELEQFKGCL